MTFADKIGQEAFLNVVTDFFTQRYQDRGMRKWQGYFLSDHTAALKRAHKQALPESALPQQDQSIIRQLLAKAFAQGQGVQLQLNSVSSDLNWPQVLSGMVLGFDEADEVILADLKLPIAAIRHVTMIDPKPQPE